MNTKFKKDNKLIQENFDHTKSLVCHQLNKIIEEKKLSYYQVQQITGHAQSSLDKYKNQEALPTFFILISILTCLNVPINIFFKKCFTNELTDYNEPNIQSASSATSNTSLIHSFVAENQIDNLYFKILGPNGEINFIPLKDYTSDYNPT